MPTAQQDTEITLGTGRMLAIFFGLVLVCAFFFAVGFSLGRKTAGSGAGGLLSSSTVSPSAIVRPSAAKNNGTQQSGQASDFGFYKAVGEKTADSGLTPASPEARTASTGSAGTQSASSPSAADAGGTGSSGAGSTGGGAASPGTASSASANGSYFVQVAAVSRQEDAESLVEALKKKQYPAFSSNNPAIDKFYHVQVGPYGELKDAESMRARLISDGYNPIVKK
jgi:DedD protein